MVSSSDTPKIRTTRQFCRTSLLNAWRVSQSDKLCTIRGPKSESVLSNPQERLIDPLSASVNPAISKVSPIDWKWATPHLKIIFGYRKLSNH